MMRLVRLAMIALLLGLSSALAEPAAIPRSDVALRVAAQAGEPSVTSRVSRWTRTKLEAAKKRWAENRARFKECVVELDALKKKQRMSYDSQGHFLQRCMAGER
jgi:hypothetical protein